MRIFHKQKKYLETSGIIWNKYGFSHEVLKKHNEYDKSLSNLKKGADYSTINR